MKNKLYCGFPTGPRYYVINHNIPLKAQNSELGGSISGSSELGGSISGGNTNIEDSDQFGDDW